LATQHVLNSSAKKSAGGKSSITHTNMKSELDNILNIQDQRRKRNKQPSTEQL
jgi:hypothetical protein